MSEGGDEVELQPVPRADYVRGPELARGRTSRVLSAHDVRHDRPVALKELLDRSPAARARFIRQALIAGHVSHPAIVPVYQAGVWDDDHTPFFAMRMVSGTSLAHLATGARSQPARLALISHLVATADALAVAHRHGLVHGDLGLARVMADRGETLVLGWGLHDRGGDPRTDVRQLGRMLHELVGGATGAVPAELRSIIARATAVVAERRYRDGSELAAELRRYLAGERVHAHRYRSTALAARWARRHRALMVAGPVLIAALGIAAVSARRPDPTGAAAALAPAVRAERERQAAAEHAAVLTRRQRELTELGRSRLRRGKPLEALAYLSRSYALGDRTVALRYLLARALRAVAGVPADLPDGVTVGELSADGRRVLVIGPDRGALLDAAGRPIASLGGATRVVIAHEAATAVLATATLATVVDLDGGAVRAAVPVEGLRDVAVSADGRLIAVLTASGRLQVHADGGVARWSVSVGSGHRRVALSRDGTMVETCAEGHRCTVRELRLGRIVTPPPTSTLRGPYGRMLAVLPPSVLVEDAADRGRLPGFAVIGAVAPSGDLLAIAEGATLSVWDTSTGDLTRSFTADDARIVDLRFDPDGRSLAVVDSAGAIRIWDVDHGLVRAELPGVGAHGTVRYSRDGRLLTLRGRQAWLSTVAELGVPAHLAAPTRATSVAFAHDGRLAITSRAGVWIRDPGWRQLTREPADAVRFAPGGGAVAIAAPTQLEVRAVDTGAAAWTAALTAPVTRLQWEGDRVLTVAGGSATIYRAVDGATRDRLPALRTATLIPGGEVVAAVGHDLERRAPGSRTPRWSQRVTFEPTWSDVSADGTWLVAGDTHAVPTLCELTRVAPTIPFEDEDPDRPIDLPAAGHDDPVDRARDLLGMGMTARYVALLERPYLARATPSGFLELAELFRGVGDCRRARQYNARAGATVVDPPLHLRRAIEIQRLELRRCVARPSSPTAPVEPTVTSDGLISRDGALVITASRQRGLRIWDREGRLLEVRPVPDIADLDLRPDGRTLALVYLDGTVDLWDVALEQRPPDEVDAIVRRLAPWRVTDDDRLEAR